MNQNDIQHINRMKAIMKAIQPFIDENRIQLFAYRSSSIMKDAYNSAKDEIKHVNESYNIYE